MNALKIGNVRNCQSKRKFIHKTCHVTVEKKRGKNAITAIQPNKHSLQYKKS